MNETNIKLFRIPFYKIIQILTLTDEIDKLLAQDNYSIYEFGMCLNQIGNPYVLVAINVDNILVSVVMFGDYIEKQKYTNNYSIILKSMVIKNEYREKNYDVVMMQYLLMLLNSKCLKCNSLYDEYYINVGQKQIHSKYSLRQNNLGDRCLYLENYILDITTTVNNYEQIFTDAEEIDNIEEIKRKCIIKKSLCKYCDNIDCTGLCIYDF